MFPILFTEEGVCHSCCPSPSSPSNPVDIILNASWKIIIDYNPENNTINIAGRNMMLKSMANTCFILP